MADLWQLYYQNIKCKDCDCFLECESVKENSMKYESFSWNKNYSKKLMKNQKKDLRPHLSFTRIIL